MWKMLLIELHAGNCTSETDYSAVYKRYVLLLLAEWSPHKF